MKAGVIGLGDMGSGLAKNLIAAGFETVGLDLDAARMAAFTELGGRPAASAAEVGANATFVFVMVMNGTQAKSVILGDREGEGLRATMAPGGVILLTATIKTVEAREIAAALESSGLHLIDAPVTGGFAGAQGGTLTLMAAGTDEAMEAGRPAMEAVGSTIHRVGDTFGEGQTMKACLQSLIGAIFSATFEATVLAAKAGVSPQALYDVFTTSGAGCGVVKMSLANIVDGKFSRTGSHINTMHKDLTITLDLARDLGVPLFTASTAMQLFEAGKTKHPDGDNWATTQVLEEIVGAKLRR